MIFLFSQLLFEQFAVHPPPSPPKVLDFHHKCRGESPCQSLGQQPNKAKHTGLNGKHQNVFILAASLSDHFPLFSSMDPTSRPSPIKAPRLPLLNKPYATLRPVHQMKEKVQWNKQLWHTNIVFAPL